MPDLRGFTDGMGILNALGGIGGSLLLVSGLMAGGGISFFLSASSLNFTSFLTAFLAYSFLRLSYNS